MVASRFAILRSRSAVFAFAQFKVAKMDVLLLSFLTPFRTFLIVIYLWSSCVTVYYGSIALNSSGAMLIYAFQMKGLLFFQLLFIVMSFNKYLPVSLHGALYCGNVSFFPSIAFSDSLKEFDHQKFFA